MGIGGLSGPEHSQGGVMSSTKRTTISNRTEEGRFAEIIREYPEHLPVISEGDSWFSYPINSNLADFIEMMAPLNMFRLERAGDEACRMLAPNGSQRRKLEQYFKRYRKHLKLLIFSGGGNDILDDNLPPLLIKRRPGMTWRDCINDSALANRLNEVRDAYLRLLGTRDATAPDCQIVSHGYDYLIPTGRRASAVFGLIKRGPWILPRLRAFGIEDPVDGQQLLRHLIDAFWATISPLASPARKFHLVDSRGTLSSDSSHWNDEIHPTHRGFEALAEKWRPILGHLFPAAGF
jgi:lysophospholipase L1-like esterase